MYLIKTIDESLHGGVYRGDRPRGFVLGLGRAAGRAGVAAATTRRRGWPGRWFLQRDLILRHVPQVFVRWYLVEQLVLAFRQPESHLLGEMQQPVQILQLLRAPRQLRLRPLLQLWNVRFDFAFTSFFLCLSSFPPLLSFSLFIIRFKEDIWDIQSMKLYQKQGKTDMHVILLFLILYNVNILCIYIHIYIYIYIYIIKMWIWKRIMYA